MSGPPAFEPIHTPPSESSRPFWPIALVLGALIVVAAAIGVWAFLDRGPAATPTPAAVATPTPVPAATPPAASPTPDATPNGAPTAAPVDGTPGPDVRAQIEAIVAQIPGLRQLDELRDVPYEFVTRAQFQDDLQDLIADETDPEQLALEERLLKRLGLLPPEMDLGEALLELYGSQVAAFYRPDTGAFYIIGEHQSLAPFDRMVVAHEYTHALQDQHFDLEGSRITDPSEGDAALAQLAAIEGDATLLMFYWGLQNLTQQELTGLGDSLNPADLELLEAMPPILRRQLEFPYSEGFLFSLEVFTSSPGGWAAIDETLRNPPATTEQILHPEKYFAGEAAVPVEIPDLSVSLGSGWTRTYEQTMGELNLQVWVGGGEEPIETFPGMPPEQPHADVAAGWGGDRLAMYESGTDGWAIAWEIAWDTDADAENFLTRARELQDTLDGESLIMPIASDRVLLLIAHDQPTLDSLAMPFGVMRSGTP
jgi:hypothetical protein